ncbi:hypothetical protein GUITHDRAFT_164011 [Guillardia theta CCMP2712]|uniref:Peptidyl-prolyl cis-trans isomerase n=1 Tax=Guillardia theta (strain CCMP2712) TaxID=905079 RepID=L1J3Q6_GUITC|nr:hypothetical protein GUITHDRAFT_164011 [Guillardia theta CCMP2712]EKX42754.1 hypothetical protein GUITHDRAFT_164011 [Guillardia theta CCMP2712]|mmetsp:Transcript_34173/g.107062  ORF Transcript_34173/g.107062 Transcript_34173/m.107062 type:complete len:123 (+) Transcript_34173:35-403(+)|eukprot:XP_005829734.1 hypothetical protein GUITHDRAFT_164011 [Guillardia theta CCMP2712]
MTMKKMMMVMMAMAVICHTANAISATANHILVKEEAKCLELKKSIESASDVLSKFQEVAKEHSTCPSGKNGGSLGEFGPGQMVKEFNDVVFTTGKVGKVEGPVQTQFGYHLILITKRGNEAM